eukprot:TRINITY_DN45503_c0_g1_i1.p1 TRINITY_DN45503_c0_g1~~TRINITY_DN45503_c0_g1_i1.p1  ORF type:complete len:109 (-),score=12.21 TRINITY_DN45503_c0_g1_i1:73-399(-)
MTLRNTKAKEKRSRKANQRDLPNRPCKKLVGHDFSYTQQRKQILGITKLQDLRWSVVKKLAHLISPAGTLPPFPSPTKGERFAKKSRTTFVRERQGQFRPHEQENRFT